MRIGGEVEGAEGVALAGHVLPQKVSRPVHLQVCLQVWLLLEGRLETQEISCFTFYFRNLHRSNFKELLVLLLVHVEAGLHMLDQLHLVHLGFGTFEFVKFDIVKFAFVTFEFVKFEIA